jgi:hypothetical protein
MTTETKYNGYTNYETWNCALWLDNEQYTQEQISEHALNLVEGMTDLTDKDEIYSTTKELADFIENLVNEIYEEQLSKLSGMVADLANASMREIDYFDIAQSQIADPLREAQEASLLCKALCSETGSIR